jgi:hypothetical protein
MTIDSGKYVDVLDPTGSRKRFGGYSEIANAEAAGYYSLKDHVLDRLYIGLAAIENEVKGEGWTRDKSRWEEVCGDLGSLIQKVEKFKEEC